MRCHYFVLPQRTEDRVLEVLVRKTETIKRELGSLSKVIDDDVERRLRGGIRHRDAERLTREIEAADLDAVRRRVAEEELEAARDRRNDLAAQVDRCRGLLNRSRDLGGVRRGAISRRAVLCARAARRRAAGAGRRRAWPTHLDLPAARPPHRRRPELGGDAGHPPDAAQRRTRSWRTGAARPPIRPVVFEDAGVLSDDTVHLHLEQRVAQRLLARFRAQGFVYNDLSRACLAQTRDSIPRVILLGRLCLYGRRAERLHEEIVPLAARWVEPARRNGPLNAYARDAETRTLDLLEQALGRPDRTPHEIIRAKLLAAAARDISELLPQPRTAGRRARHAGGATAA